MNNVPLSQESIDTLSDIIRHQQAELDRLRKHDDTVDHDFCRNMDGTYDPVQSTKDVIRQKHTDDHGGIVSGILKMFGGF